MNFHDACIVLQNLRRTHTVQPFTARRQGFLFEAGITYTPAEIADFEASVGKRLPAEYAEFLSMVGAGRLFIDDRGRGIDFLPLGELGKFSKSVFDNFGTDPFPDLMLAVSLPRVGGFGGFALDEGGNNENCFSVFSSEDDPSEWVAAGATFNSFSSWLIVVTQSHGGQTWIE